MPRTLHHLTSLAFAHSREHASILAGVVSGFMLVIGRSVNIQGGFYGDGTRHWLALPEHDVAQARPTFIPVVQRTCLHCDFGDVTQS